MRTKLGDLVEVRKANISNARKVVMKTPHLEYSSLDPRYFTDALESIAVKVGDNVWVPYFNKRLEFEIAETTPNKDIDCVMVTQYTHFSIDIGEQKIRDARD